MGVSDRWIDKSGWGDGPWQHEPDRVEGRDGAFVRLALRNPRMGNWCGYVGVPPGHPWHGQHLVGSDLAVHGGVTFSDGCMDDERPARERVCHVPAPGEPDDVWWVGFDCHHAWDIAPAFVARERARGWGELHDEVYRDLAYVEEEITGLVEQARAAQS